MDFTRQPIIESVITAKEGCKLVVRSSKGSGQEEYFVDAVEVVAFGSSFFFRSLEKPKSFLVPASDYEVLEVREARMVLKNVGVDRSIKIGGGREAAPKATAKEADRSAAEQQQGEQEAGRGQERKRDRRRSFRRRKRGEESADVVPSTESLVPPPPPLQEKPIELSAPKKSASMAKGEGMELNTTVLKSLLPPPPNLISETIEKYKDNKLFEGVFMGSKQEKEAASAEENAPSEGFAESDAGVEEPYDIPESHEQEIVEQRQKSGDQHQQFDYDEHSHYGHDDDKQHSEPFTSHEKFTEEESRRHIEAASEPADVEQVEPAEHHENSEEHDAEGSVSTESNNDHIPSTNQ